MSISGPEPWRLVLAGVGGDAHSVGLTILRRALERAGHSVDDLGTQNEVGDICEAARAADAVLVSNMDGHAAFYLEHLRAEPGSPRRRRSDLVPRWQPGPH